MDKEKVLELYNKYKEYGNKWIKIASELKIDNPEKVRAFFRYHFGEINNIRKINSETSIKSNYEEISSKIIEKLLSKKDLVQIPFKKGIKRGKLIEDAILVLSDSHVGKKNIWMNPTTGENETTYNIDIFIKKANQLVKRIYTLEQLLSNSYNLRKLYIIFLGDIIDNHIIYKGQTFNVDIDVGQQVWVAVRVFSDIIKSMLSLFKEVEVVGITGNHGRMSGDYPELITSNFDYQLYKILEVYFKDEKRIKFIIPENWYYVLNIQNWKYFLHHGSTVYSWLSLPYYGIVRQSKSRRLEIDYDVEFIAHFHQRMEIPTSSKTRTIVGGCWISKDSYGWRKFGSISRAEQLFLGVSDSRPISWSFVVDLEKY